MDSPKKIVIAIDGYASCGKSTMAKELARKIGYVYIDSGAMYRAVTLYCIEEGLFEGDALQLDALRRRIDNIDISFRLNAGTGRPETYLNGRNVEREIRSMAVSSKVSHVAAVGFVRSKLVALQQAMGKEKGIVMDGRDIGTVVFPDAELKIFLTASPEVRAQRRVGDVQNRVQLLVAGRRRGKGGVQNGGALGCAHRLAGKHAHAFARVQRLQNFVVHRFTLPFWRGGAKSGPAVFAKGCIPRGN